MSDNVVNKCRDCVNMRRIPGDCHISCANPDLNMTGNKLGIQSGWFMYPVNFDPIWMTKKCDNFEEKK